MKPKELRKWCPECEHQVELDRQVSGGIEVYKCRNCWAIHMNLSGLSDRPIRRHDDAASSTN